MCHNRRIYSHKVFRALAARGKTSVDWFYGFKLHLAINDRGELLGVRLTPGNVDDRVPVPAMTKALWGQMFADSGYISHPLFERLFAQGLQLVTKIKGCVAKTIFRRESSFSAVHYAAIPKRLWTNFALPLASLPANLLT